MGERHTISPLKVQSQDITSEKKEDLYAWELKFQNIPTKNTSIYRPRRLVCA